MASHPQNKAHAARRHRSLEAMMPILSTDMRDTIRRAKLSFVATVNEDGTPNVSPKASLTARGDALFFADIASPQTIENLRRNPAISINVVDIFARRGYRFNGTGRLLPTTDPDWKEVAEWVWRMNGPDYPVNHVVRIEVREALPVLSPAYRFAEPVSEDALRQVYLAIYGVGGRDMTSAMPQERGGQVSHGADGNRATCRPGDYDLETSTSPISNRHERSEIEAFS
jgi:predicted pyridoxine 5'-phosphate oxidase superfamily flavin-nucleotide-binding protein